MPITDVLITIGKQSSEREPVDQSYFVSGQKSRETLGTCVMFLKN